MPRRPTWFDRIPDILAELEKPTAAPFFDREAIERLFGLKRRRAILLMKKELKHYAIGNAYVVDRAAIIRFLRKHRKPGREETERQQRVIDTLAEFRREANAGLATIPIPIRGVKKAMLETSIAGLPPGIELAPGRLSITFKETNELLQKLFELSKAIHNDLESFLSLLSPHRAKKEEAVDYVTASW